MDESPSIPAPGAHRPWVFATVLSLVGALGLLALEVYVLDPFMHFHKPWFGYSFVSWKDTYLNPGLAKFADYDTVVVGGSYVQNTKVSTVDKLFGAKAIKLTNAGGTPANMQRLLQLGLESGHDVKLAIIALPITKFESSNVDALRSELPEYLYDDDVFNDVSYLFNVDVYIAQSKAVWKSLHSRHHSDVSWLDEAYSWIGSYQGRTGKEYLLKHYDPPQRGKPLPKDFYLDRASKQFDAHIEPVLAAHPATTFKIFFPPFSRLLWRDKLDAGTLEAELEVKRLLIARLLAHGNVEVYDFMSLPEVSDLNNYKDRSHFLPSVSELVTQGMTGNQYRVTSVPTQADLDAFVEFVRTYDDPDIPRSPPGEAESAEVPDDTVNDNF